MNNVDTYILILIIFNMFYSKIEADSSSNQVCNINSLERLIILLKSNFIHTDDKVALIIHVKVQIVLLLDII